MSLEVVVRKAERRWYDFVTQVFAIVAPLACIRSSTKDQADLAHDSDAGRWAIA